MRRITVLFAMTMLCAPAALAAGKMDNVSQTVEIHDAKITSGPSSSGAGGGGRLGIGPIDIVSGGGGKQPGDITVGKISNEGKNMTNVTQTIKGNNATINSEGASIGVGVIENKGGGLF